MLAADVLILTYTYTARSPSDIFKCVQLNSFWIPSTCVYICVVSTPHCLFFLSWRFVVCNPLFVS